MITCKNQSFFFICALFFLWLATENVAKASCCTGTGAALVGKLLKHERAILQMSTDTRYVFASFDEQSKPTWQVPKESAQLVITPSLLLMTRVAVGIEPFIKVPVLIQQNQSQTGASLADIVLGLRIDIPYPDFGLMLPAISIISSWQMPTGTVRGDNDEFNVLKITSTGYALFSNTILLEQSLGGILVGFGYGLGIPIAINHRHDKFKEGLKHSSFISLGLSISEADFISLMLKPELHESLFNHADIIDHSDKHKLNLSISYTKRLHSHITLQTALGSDLAIPYLAKNINSGVFFSLGLRFGVF